VIEGNLRPSSFTPALGHDHLEDPSDEADWSEAAEGAPDGYVGHDMLDELDCDSGEPLLEPEPEPEPEQEPELDGLLDGSPGSEAASGPPEPGADAEPAVVSDRPKGVVQPAGLELTMIDWARDWSLAHAPVRWLAEPLLEEGRSVALVAPAKVGKSLLALEVAAAVATGRPVLAMESWMSPRRVLYLDYENSPSDVLKRVLGMGYEESELNNLMYVSLPNLPPLGTRAGAQALLAEVDRLRPDLVVLDTLVRGGRRRERLAHYHRPVSRDAPAAEAARCRGTSARPRGP